MPFLYTTGGGGGRRVALFLTWERLLCHDKTEAQHVWSAKLSTPVALDAVQGAPKERDALRGARKIGVCTRACLKGPGDTPTVYEKRMF